MQTPPRGYSCFESLLVTLIDGTMLIAFLSAAKTSRAQAFYVIMWLHLLSVLDKDIFPCMILANLSRRRTQKSAEFEECVLAYAMDLVEIVDVVVLTADWAREVHNKYLKDVYLSVRVDPFTLSDVLFK